MSQAEQVVRQSFDQLADRLDAFRRARAMADDDVEQSLKDLDELEALCEQLVDYYDAGNQPKVLETIEHIREIMGE